MLGSLSPSPSSFIIHNTVLTCHLPADSKLAYNAAFSYLGQHMAIHVNFTPEQEAKLARFAAKAGTDPEHLLKAAALHLLENEARTAETAPELPVWHLGASGSFQRRDLYDDLG